MKRTESWWQNLTAEERSTLVYLERSANLRTSMGGYLPDDCSSCSACGGPMMGCGLCSWCSSELDELIRKADSGVK